MKYILLIACILTLFIACNDDTKVCDVDVRTETRVRFRTKPRGLQERDTTLPEVTLFAVGKDSIYRSQRGLTGMQFSLDRLSDSARFYFRTDDSVRTGPADTLIVSDVLVFYYKRQPKFVSAGCGIILTYAIDSVKYTTGNSPIKTLLVNQHIVTTGNETNITLTF
ncbi:hypothetical protein GFS24_26845 [Chitinophaga sp. SYP-B3965]|uniref:DUF6452 family protein n=1 Tax=Chitinophaga sp. SYP-B3965 TaxID=2663120 RepID=UPI001299CF19|nr:DUF6452 family protein [Chitinophaga sp. SYP-B3965]MRG48759.1 hypothetical protein [Chitinophaga sp. SYP-B3965]